jgi:hypothetical protein
MLIGREVKEKQGSIQKKMRLLIMRGMTAWVALRISNRRMAPEYAR